MKGIQRRLVVVTIAAFMAGAAAWAEDLPTVAPEEVGLSSERLARIGPVVMAEIKRGQYPGAVVLVARKGKIAYFEAFGQLDPARGTPMTRDALFRIYSMTKPITSVAAMMLMEEGRLRMTDPVSKFLPQFGNLEVSVPTMDTGSGNVTYKNVPVDRPMTIQDLLRHTSGLVYTGFTAHTAVKERYAKENVGWDDMTALEQVDRLSRVPLAHQPGTTFEYGLSTDILGRVIESIVGVPLGQHLEERIFAPLRMTETSFVVPQFRADRLAQPFPVDPATGNPIKLLDVTRPPKNDAGGAGSAATAADYLRFLQMMLNGGKLDSVRLLSRSTVDYMTADHLGQMRAAGSVTLPPGIGFGLGFAVRKEPGIVEFPGSAGEYFWAGAAGTGFYVDPHEELICVFMTQAAPGMPRRYDRYLLKQMVYQAIDN